MAIDPTSGNGSEMATETTEIPFTEELLREALRMRILAQRVPLLSGGHMLIVSPEMRQRMTLAASITDRAREQSWTELTYHGEEQIIPVLRSLHEPHCIPRVFQLHGVDVMYSREQTDRFLELRRELQRTLTPGGSAGSTVILTGAPTRDIQRLTTRPKFTILLGPHTPSERAVVLPACVARNPKACEAAMIICDTQTGATQFVAEPDEAGFAALNGRKVTLSWVAEPPVA